MTSGDRTCLRSASFATFGMASRNALAACKRAVGALSPSVTANALTLVGLLNSSTALPCALLMTPITPSKQIAASRRRKNMPGSPVLVVESGSVEFVAQIFPRRRRRTSTVSLARRRLVSRP
ncbi:MAG: hypothetical protein KDA41_15985 [Planctomycetales bacterium]|nr:hypothetical protein [Planctomycetales bacterium]